MEDHWESVELGPNKRQITREDGILESLEVMRVHLVEEYHVYFVIPKQSQRLGDSDVRRENATGVPQAADGARIIRGGVLGGNSRHPVGSESRDGIRGQCVTGEHERVLGFGTQSRIIQQGENVSHSQGGGLLVPDAGTEVMGA
jgi:hypothetical protein